MAFGLVILVIVLMVPLMLFAMNGIVSQAEVLHNQVVKGQLAYAKVASDADSLRAATLEAATSADAARSAAQLATAKDLVKQFPDDARKMTELFCPKAVVAAGASPAADADTTSNCAMRHDEIGKLVDTFGTSASAFDFQALSAVSLLQQNRRADALKQINGASSDAYEKQNQDGESMLGALNRLSDDRYDKLIQARNLGFMILLVGLAVAVVLVFTLGQWLRRIVLRSIGRCVEVFEAMGTGDLSKRVNWHGSDLMGRLGQAIDDFANRLSTMIVQIQRASITVQNASQQSNAIVAQVDARVKEELAALSQALSYSGDLFSASGTVADNAEAVARRVSDISSSVAEMTASIQEMDQNLLNLATVVEQAVANTQEMSASIVQVAGNADRVRSESNVTDQQGARRPQRSARAFEGHGLASATPSPTSSPKCRIWTAPRVKSARSSASSKRSPIKRTCSRSTPQSKRPVPANTAAASPSSRTKSASSPRTRPARPSRSASSSPTSSAAPRPFSTRTARANSLVQSNAESARNVTQMIETISKRVTEVAQLVSEISIATTEQARASEELAKASEQMGAMTHEAAATMREQAITSNQILESVSEIENRTAQVARASTEQQSAIEGLGERIQQSSNLGSQNSEAVAGMAASADEVHSQASTLRQLVGQFQTGQAAVEKSGSAGQQALEDPGALALSS